MFKQPKGFSATYITALCDILSFYGVMSGIIILLITIFRKDASFSYQFYGELTGIGYMAPVVGGALVDRLFRRAPAVMMGIIFILLGNICAALMTFNGLIWGISLMMAGTGLLKSNNVNIAGILFPPFSKDKEKGITLVYLGMNCGAILGPVVAALTGYFLHAYRDYFLFSACLFLIPLIIFARNYQYLVMVENQDSKETRKSLSTPLFLGLMIAVVLIIRFMFANPIFFNIVFFGGIAVAVGYLLKIIWQNSKIDRLKIFYILALCVFNMFYYVCAEQMSGALTLFGQLYSSGVLKLNIPMQWLSSIEPLFIILASPFVMRLSKHRQGHDANIHLTLRKFLWSLVASGVAYICFYLSGTHLTHEVFFMVMFLVGIFLIGFGELVSIPPLFDAISNLVDEKFRGFFIGVTYVIMAVASYFGSLIAMAMVGNENGPSNIADYPKFFAAFAIMAFVSAIAFIAMRPVLRKWVGVKA